MTLTEFLTGIADALRQKLAINEPIKPVNFIKKIKNLSDEDPYDYTLPTNLD